jgi:carbamate kinase
MLYNRDTTYKKNYTFTMLNASKQEKNMSGTYVVLIEGEILLNNRERAFDEQYHNAYNLAQGLMPILANSSKMALICDNHPHIGYVLYRSELSSHLLHPVPLDVAIADSQGAIGYLLMRAFTNMLHEHAIQREVSNVFTRVLVEKEHDHDTTPLQTIGPVFDRERAEHYQRTRGWMTIEEPGYGYRRAVYSTRPIKILELSEIQALISQGNIVVAGGGGGVPVYRNDEGNFVGAEELVESEFTSVLLTQGIQAEHFWIVMNKENGFLRYHISIDPRNEMSLEQLDDLLEKNTLDSPSILSKLKAADRFLHDGGREVLITSMRQLPNAVSGQSGLFIHH